MTKNEGIEIPIIAITGHKSRGGLQDYNEARGKGVQRVRGEFLSQTFKPKITIAIDNLTFNTSCVNLFPDVQYVVVHIDETNLRLFIEPANSYDRDSLKFANFKNDRNNPRKCIARYFGDMLFDLMDWNRKAKYRCLAIFQEFEEKRIIVFNLDECQQVFSELIQSDDGKKKRNTIINMPEGWKGRFGYTMDELDARHRLDFSTTLITIDNKTGERHSSQIHAKLPTPEELIHRPYGGIRKPSKEVEDD
jgi:hypothetical protein